MEVEVILDSAVDQTDKTGSATENFVVQEDPSELCEQTETPNQDEDENQVAVPMDCDAEQNDDQNGIVDDPPDMVPKEEKFYPLVQKMTKVNLFIGACEKAVANSLAESTLDIEIPGDVGIRFNIPEPIDPESFCGREDFLTQLHDNLKIKGEVKGQRSKSKLPTEAPLPMLLSQNENDLKIVAVCGPDGIGKTETVRKYITKYGRFYSNIIWIEAETENSMKNSFVNLADVNELEIPVENSNSEGKHREIKEIVKEIYNKICEGGQSNLIVFDNAGDYQSWSKFFPLEIPPDLKKPVILVTSKSSEPEWISSSPNGTETGAGKIQFQVLPLDVLTDNERLEYIRKQLKIPDSARFKEKSKEFIELVGGLPLALQQAVTYIKQEKGLRKLIRKSYEVWDYVLDFKRSSNKFRSFLVVSGSGSHFSASVFLTWNVTVEKIQRLGNGEEAKKILEILSFLYADKIPSSFLRDLVPEINDRQFSGALKLLEKYSLIKVNYNKNENGNDFSIKIHRQLQLVILHYLKTCEDARRTNVLINLVEKCSGILENLDVENCKNSDIFLNIQQIVEDPFSNLNPMAEEFLDLQDEFAWVLWDAGRHSESLELWQKVHGKFTELLGQNHEKTLESEHQIAVNMEKLGREDEALRLFKQNLLKKEIHPDFGPDHSDIVEIKYNIASILRRQKKNQIALFWFQQVLAHRIKNQEENDLQTLALQDQMAQIYTELGNFSKALALYTDVEKKQKRKTSEAGILSPDSDANLDPDHQQNCLITTQNKAAVLYAMGKFRETAKTFKEIYAKQSKILGEKNSQTVNTQVWIAKSLEQTGKFQEAFDLYKKVYEIRKRNSGVDHPQTIHAKFNMANVLRQQKKYEESLEIFQQVLLQKNKIHGENHPETFKTQNSIAQLHAEKGDFQKALKMLEGFEKIRAQLLGGLNEHVVETKQQRAVVFHQMDQFEEAAKLFREVYEAKKETLGDRHEETIKALRWVKGTEVKQKTLTKAVGTWRKVKLERAESKVVTTIIPDHHHSETPRTPVKIKRNLSRLQL